MPSRHVRLVGAAVVCLAVLVFLGSTLASEDPWIGIMSPDPGSGPVDGTVPIDVWVEEDSEFEKVEYFVDGQLIGEDTTKPFSLEWDTTSLEDAEHTIQAKGTIEGGIVKESKPVVIEVDNN